MVKKVVIVVIVILIGIQFIPVERSNPPVTEEIVAPANVSSILKTSCYDCHSNETNWPWYAYVAPVSFLIAQDVKDGRRHLNFSEWDKYDEKKKRKIPDKILEEVEEGKMPLGKYISMHSEAEINQDKLKILKDWVVRSHSKKKTQIEKNVAN